MALDVVVELLVELDALLDELEETSVPSSEGRAKAAAVASNSFVA